MSIAVLAPVLARPQRAQPLADSLTGSSVIPVELVFLCSKGDTAEIAACRETHARVIVVPWEPCQGDYARKLNYAVERTDSMFVFFAADDLVFHPGWAERAVVRWHETGACVIGTNDLGNERVVSGNHSTHTLVHRGYVECGTVDDDTRLLHEGYWHNFVDDEFIATAKSRGTFVAAQDSIVEHLHPNWRKGNDDSTYQRGKEHYWEDRDHFENRKRLWS